MFHIREVKPLSFSISTEPQTAVAEYRVMLSCRAIRYDLALFNRSARYKIGAVYALLKF
jgi:hypothetical protein